MGISLLTKQSKTVIEFAQTILSALQGRRETSRYFYFLGRWGNSVYKYWVWKRIREIQIPLSVSL